MMSRSSSRSNYSIWNVRCCLSSFWLIRILIICIIYQSFIFWSISIRGSIVGSEGEGKGLTTLITSSTLRRSLLGSKVTTRTIGKEVVATKQQKHRQPPKQQKQHYHLWLVTCETRTIEESIDYQAWLYTANEFAKLNNNKSGNDDADDDGNAAFTTTVHVENVCVGLDWNIHSFYTKMKGVYDFIIRKKLPITKPTTTSPSTKLTTTTTVPAHDDIDEKHFIFLTDSDVVFNSYGVTAKEVINRYCTIIRNSRHDKNDNITDIQDETEDIEDHHKIILASEPSCWIGEFCSMKYLRSNFYHTHRSSCGQFVNAGSYVGLSYLVYDMLSNISNFNHTTNGNGPNGQGHGGKDGQYIGDYIGGYNDDQAMLNSWYSKNNGQYYEFTKYGNNGNKKLQEIKQQHLLRLQERKEKEELSNTNNNDINATATNVRVKKKKKKKTTLTKEEENEIRIRKPFKAVLDIKGSIFRSLSLGIISHLPQHATPNRYAKGYVCGANNLYNNSEWKTCGLYNPPLWDITNYDSNHEDDDQNNLPIIRINPYMPDPGCSILEEIPFAIHGNGQLATKRKYEEYVRYITNGTISHHPQDIS